MEAPPGSAVLDRDGLRGLVAALRERGYTVIGPTVRDQAIVLDELASIDDLPAGWTDEQEGGGHRLRRRDDAALFGYAVGPHSWKPFLFPPSTRLWRASRRGHDAVGTLYACDEALRLLDDYQVPDRPAVAVEPREGVGQGCTEAPRGIRYHRYRRCEQAIRNYDPCISCAAHFLDLRVERS